MTVEAFNALETVDQIRIARSNDTLIGHRGEGPKSMHLYVVDDFYVEVIFATRKKHILDVHASRDECILEPYLNQIDLSELFG